MRQIAISGLAAQVPEQSTRMEWLLTNGLGGYACGTVAGAPSRRYHGLLVSAPRPEDRYMVLPQLQEEVARGSESWELGATKYPDVWHPQGYMYIQRFTLYPAPSWVYGARDWLLQKTIYMPHGRNATVVCYRLLHSASPVLLRLRPLVAIRGYHTLQSADNTEYVCEQVGEWRLLRAHEGTPAALMSASGRFTSAGTWYKNIQYEVERERGLDYQEDWYCPGEFCLELQPEQSGWFWVCAGSAAATTATAVPEAPHQPATAAKEAETAAASRITWLLAQAGQPTGAAAHLVVAADSFIIKRGQNTSVIAGYPWFTDWGRDAMISLPGLFLATGRAEEGCSMLTTFAEAASDGLIPNRFPDVSTTPEYNTVDAPLWFIYAWWKCLQHVGRTKQLLELWPTVRAIITGYRQGTKYNIGVDKRGLLGAGAAGQQLTWMDAKAGDWVVTPRRGFPVEISGLWYNALCVAADVGAQVDPEFTQKCQGWAEETRQAFLPAFWLPEQKYLADVIEYDGSADISLRPNQLLTISLPFPLLTGEDARQVVQCVWAELLTPMGLRTLAPADPAYQPHYRGDQVSRDGAYHQGTVWAWLIGPFISAYLQVYGRTPYTLQIARKLMAPLLDHMTIAGLGHISEIFEGAAPHLPDGSFAQAWSVAEILRLWAEEFGHTPLEPSDDTLC